MSGQQKEEKELGRSICRWVKAVEQWENDDDEEEEQEVEREEEEEEEEGLEKSNEKIQPWKKWISFLTKDITVRVHCFSYYISFNKCTY